MRRQSPATARHPTAAGALYRFAPAGADVAIEIDLARLRDNAALGPLVAAAAEAGFSAGGLDARIAEDLDVVLLCAYGVGSAQAATLTLMRGPHAAAVPGATPVARDVFGLGPPALIARAQAAFSPAGEASGRDGEPTLADDAHFSEIRDAAMPDAATGAVLRVTAVLDFDARVALAGKLALDTVPRAVSVWGDVADDLAAVAVLVAENPAEAAQLALLVERARNELATGAAVRLLGIAAAIHQARISARGSATTAILVIPPSLLSQVVARAKLALVAL